MQLHGLVGGSAEVIGPDATLLEASEHMIESGVGYLGVVNRRELVGILTEHDIVQAVAQVTNIRYERRGWSTRCVAGASFVTLRFGRSVGAFVSSRV